MKEKLMPDKKYDLQGECTINGVKLTSNLIQGIDNLIEFDPRKAKDTISEGFLFFSCSDEAEHIGKDFASVLHIIWHLIDELDKSEAIKHRFD